MIVIASTRGILGHKSNRKLALTCGLQMAEVAVPRQMFQEILSLIAGSGRRPRRHDREIGEMRRPA